MQSRTGGTHPENTTHVQVQHIRALSRVRSSVTKRRITPAERAVSNRARNEHCERLCTNISTTTKNMTQEIEKMRAESALLSGQKEDKIITQTRALADFVSDHAVVYMKHIFSDGRRHLDSILRMGTTRRRGALRLYEKQPEHLRQQFVPACTRANRLALENSK